MNNNWQSQGVTISLDLNIEGYVLLEFRSRFKMILDPVKQFPLVSDWLPIHSNQHIKRFSQGLLLLDQSFQKDIFNILPGINDSENINFISRDPVNEPPRGNDQFSVL